MTVYDDRLFCSSFKMPFFLKDRCTDFQDHLDLDFDFVVVSPGISLRHPLCQKIFRLKLLVVSAISFALQYVDSRVLCVGVTGTNGKTTTSNLLARSLNQSDMKTFLVGNSGVPLSYILYKGFSFDALVLELSSYQLELPLRRRLSWGILVSLGQDHLERHLTYDSYLLCKKRLISSSDSVFVHVDCCLEDPLIWDLINLKKDSFFYSSSFFPSSFVYLTADKKVVCFQKGEIQKSWSRFKEIFEKFISSVLFEHDCSSLLLVWAFLLRTNFYQKFMGKWDAIYIKKPYRCQVIGDSSFQCARIVNDSKATNCHATLSALRSFHFPIILILGGRLKGDESRYFFEFSTLIFSKCRQVYLYGESSSFFMDQLSKNSISFKVCSHLEEVCQHLKLEVQKLDLVLFSPACSSQDQFENYLDRGSAFNRFIGV